MEHVIRLHNANRPIIWISTYLSYANDDEIYIQRKMYVGIYSIYRVNVKGCKM